MSDDVENMIRRKALEIAAKHMASPKMREKRPLAKEEVLSVLRGILKGERAQEVLDVALQLYGDSVMPLLRKIVELKQQGVIAELWDHELYRFLANAGFVVPLKTRVRIMRQGKEHKIGEEG